MDKNIFIGIPINDEKSYCFFDLIAGLKKLISATNHKVIIAFALHRSDSQIISYLKSHTIGMNCHLLFVPRENISTLKGRNFLNEKGKISYFTNIAIARDCLRIVAMKLNADYLFYQDADGCIEPCGLNKLLSRNEKVSSCLFAIRPEWLSLGAVDITSLSKEEQIKHGIIYEKIDQDGDSKNHISKRSHSGQDCYVDIGFGACLIKKDIFIKTPIKIGVSIATQKFTCSEDILFFRQVGSQGVKIYADNSIETIHFYSEDLYPLGHTNRGEKISYKDFEAKFLN